VQNIKFYMPPEISLISEEQTARAFTFSAYGQYACLLSL